VVKTCWSTLGDTYNLNHPRKSKSWQHNDVWFHGMGGQMPWSTMEVSHYGRQYIVHAALYVLQLYVISLNDDLVPRHDYTFIRSHAASDSCCFRIFWKFLTVGPVSYFWWLHLQRHGELSGVCVVVESQWVLHWMKRPLFCSILLDSHLAEVFGEPCFAAVEVKRWW